MLSSAAHRAGAWMQRCSALRAFEDRRVTSSAPVTLIVKPLSVGPCREYPRLLKDRSTPLYGGMVLHAHDQAGRSTLLSAWAAFVFPSLGIIHNKRFPLSRLEVFVANFVIELKWLRARPSKLRYRVAPILRRRRQSHSMRTTRIQYWPPCGVPLSL